MSSERGVLVTSETLREAFTEFNDATYRLPVSSGRLDAAGVSVDRLLMTVEHAIGDMLTDLEARIEGHLDAATTAAYWDALDWRDAVELIGEVIDDQREAMLR